MDKISEWTAIQTLLYNVFTLFPCSEFETSFKNVAHRSGLGGRSSLSHGPTVVAPGANHPDFQGYGSNVGGFVLISPRKYNGYAACSFLLCCMLCQTQIT